MRPTPTLDAPLSQLLPGDLRSPPRVETATFSLGWFWGPDARFGRLEGVLRTRVGYTGGSQPSPTYRQLGDHTESFQIDYDPTRLSYEALLGHFWREADPTERPYSRQYMSAVFYADETQKRLALATGRQAMAGREGPMLLSLLELATFHRAEDYHQKYYLRRYTDLMREFSAYSETQFEDSTIAMWLNAAVDGQWKREALDVELQRLGLSEAERQRLARLVHTALSHRRR